MDNVNKEFITLFLITLKIIISYLFIYKSLLSNSKAPEASIFLIAFAESSGLMSMALIKSIRTVTL